MPNARSPDALGAALTFVASAGVFGAAGYWLDRQLDTLPVFLLVGLLIGFVGGFISLLHRLAPDLLPFGPTSRNKKDRTKGSAHAEPNPEDDPHR